MKCFFHSKDLDGHCSGAIVKYYFPHCELIGIDYGDPFPWHRLEYGEEILMVDFSLSRQEMIKLNGTYRLIWIDHHKTAIDTCSDLNMEGLQSTECAACALVYRYLMRDNSIPEFINLISKWDIWNHDSEDVVNFHYGLSLLETNPEKSMNVWKRLFDEAFNRAWGRDYHDYIFSTGKTIHQYIVKTNRENCERFSFETRFIHCDLSNYKCVAVNTTNFSSAFFDSLPNLDNYDILIGYYQKNGNYFVSLRTNKENVNVGKIAQFFQGGGHPKAAGFVSEYLPFTV